MVLKVKWAAAGSLLARDRLAAHAAAASSGWLSFLRAVQCTAARGSTQAPACVPGYNHPASEPVAAHTCGRSICLSSFTIPNRAQYPVRIPPPWWAGAEALPASISNMHSLAGAVKIFARLPFGAGARALRRF